MSGADLQIHPMEDAHVAGALDVYASCFGVDVADAAARRRGLNRMSRAVRVDPAGAFVALRGGEVIGLAQSARREGLWCLTLLAVHPDAQSTGAGRALFDRAVLSGAPLERGLIVASNDSRALRLYASAGFRLRPALRASGPVKQLAPDPGLPPVRQGDDTDLDALAPISRAVRGAAHTPELSYSLTRGAELLIVEERGFALAHPDAGALVLAAHDEAAATALLWRVLELAPEARRPMGWIPGGQDWAVRVALAAGLKLAAYGALCVLGEPGPLQPYLPNGSFA